MKKLEFNHQEVSSTTSKNTKVVLESIHAGKSVLKLFLIICMFPPVVGVIF